jgi:hypothetical protein
MPEPFAVAFTNEEINDVLIAVISVGYAVLAEDASGLNEEVACLRSLSGFG